MMSIGANLTNVVTPGCTPAYALAIQKAIQICVSGWSEALNVVAFTAADTTQQTKSVILF